MTTEGDGFVINDNRSSQLSEDDVKEKNSPEKENTDAKQASSSSDSAKTDNFKIDFSTFILSLASTAFYHLGDTPDPTTGEANVNLPAVEQTIDMLRMLNQKTQGNLTAEEHKQLEQLIYELQMKYLAKNK